MDWDRDILLNAVFSGWHGAWNETNNAFNDMTGVDWSPTTDAQIAHTFGHVRDVLNHLIDAFYSLLKQDIGVYPRWYALIGYLDLFTEELTWKSIVTAWGDIEKPAMMWTVDTIDQMRKTIWHENPNIKWNEDPFS